jgi:hypothetical protein
VDTCLVVEVDTYLVVAVGIDYYSFHNFDSFVMMSIVVVDILDRTCFVAVRDIMRYLGCKEVDYNLTMMIFGFSFACFFFVCLIFIVFIL